MKTFSIIELICIGVILLLFCLVIFGCDTLRNVDDIAQIARKSTPLVEKGKEIADEIGQADDVHDWAGIIKKIGYGVAATAVLVGGEAYRRKRKASKSNG